MSDKTRIQRTTKLPEPVESPQQDEPLQEQDAAPTGAANPDPVAPAQPFWKKTGTKIALIAGAVLLSIGLAVLAVSILPIQLTKVQAVDDYDAAALTTRELTKSVYASNVGYEIDSREVSSIEDNGFNAKVAHLTIGLRNKNFLVHVYADQNYELSGRNWIPTKSQITSVSATPIAPVEEARVLADMDTLMSKISPHEGVNFTTLYNGAEFEVASSELAEDASSCEMQIRATKLSGLYQYSGLITAKFNFVPGAASSDPGSWKLVHVSCDEDCWERSLAPITGSWQGRLDYSETSAVVFDTGVCHGAKADGLALEVTSYDVDAGKLSCNLEFTVHTHPALHEDTDHAEGDAKVKLEDLSIQLDPKDLSGSYSSQDGDVSKDSPGTWELNFFNEAGTWRVRIKSSNSSDAGLIWGATSFTDTYTLSRV